MRKSFNKEERLKIIIDCSWQNQLKFIVLKMLNSSSVVLLSRFFLEFRTKRGNLSRASLWYLITNQQDLLRLQWASMMVNMSKNNFKYQRNIKKIFYSNRCKTGGIILKEKLIYLHRFVSCNKTVDYSKIYLLDKYVNHIEEKHS